MAWFFAICAILAAFAYLGPDPHKEPEDLTDEERQFRQEKLRFEKQKTKERMDWLSYGSLRHEVICPYCETKGQVRMRTKQQKKGISGGKAVGAVFTGGASLLVTGISRREKGTQAHCCKCSTTWMV